MKKILVYVTTAIMLCSCNSEMWQGVIAGIGAAASGMSYTPYSSPSNRSGNMDYLLNPSFAVYQAQQQKAQEEATSRALMNISLQQAYDQEQAEYLEAKKHRPNLTLDQWRQEMGAAIQYGIQQERSVQTNSNVITTNPSSNYTVSPHDCSYCHGKGKIIYENSVAGLGMSSDHIQKRCNICGASYTDVHKHINCGHCGGTGKMRM